MKIYGYARCSTNESRQDITRQIKELKKMGAINPNNIYREYESGTKLDRPALKQMLDKIKREGKPCAIVCTEPSRITRSTRQLCDIVEFAEKYKVKLELGDFVLDCSKEEVEPITKGMVLMMGVFAEIERNLISQRVKSGVANARAKGKTLGRPVLTIKSIPNKVKDIYQLYSAGTITKTDYAKICGVSRPTLDKYIKVIKGE